MTQGRKDAKDGVLKSRLIPQKITKFVRIGLYGLVILAIIAFMVKTQFWIFGVAVLGLAYLLPRLRKRNNRLFEPEQSARLRQITFGAQAASILALAWPEGQKEPTVLHHKNAFEATGARQLFS